MFPNCKILVDRPGYNFFFNRVSNMDTSFDQVLNNFPPVPVQSVQVHLHHVVAVSDKYIVPQRALTAYISNTSAINIKR